MTLLQMPTKSKNRSQNPAQRSGSSKTDVSAPSNQDTLRRLYASLLRCHTVQKHARDLSSGRGEEAIVAGATAELQAGDTVIAPAHSLAALIGSTGSIGSWLPANLLLAGGERREGDGATSVAADPFNLATGIALVHKFEGKQRVVIAFCSDQECRTDALKFAGGHKLPIVYVVAGSAAKSAVRLKPVSYMAGGFPGIAVDGQDVVAMWRAAHESIHRARIGAGATLIQYRTEAEHDPLAYMEHYMRKRGAWDEQWRKRLEVEIGMEVERGV